MRVLGVFLIGLSLAILIPANAAAQTSEVTRLEGSLGQGLILVSRSHASTDPSPLARFVVNYADFSTEAIVPTAPPIIGRQLSYRIEWSGSSDPNTPPEGWSLGSNLFSPLSLERGQSGGGYFEIVHSNQVPTPTVEGVLVLTLTETTYVKDSDEVRLPWRVDMVPEPIARIQHTEHTPLRAKPFQKTEFTATITNEDFFAESYRIRLIFLPAEGVDPETIPTFGGRDIYLQGGETQEVTLGFWAPRDKFWYRNVNTIARVEVEPTQGGVFTFDSRVVEINGFYLSENLLLVVVVFGAQLFLLGFLAVYGKRRYERYFLGRPIPPWEIPQETARLERLKQEDPRAFYVTRYFLMEEEYRSALLWFSHEKRVNRRALRAAARSEHLRVLAAELETPSKTRFDRRAARLRRRYDRKTERVLRHIEHRIEALQERLDRSYQHDFDQEHAKWEDQIKRLQEKHNKPILRAHQQWEKEKASILARWEKPFRKQKKAYEEDLQKAKQKYEAHVKAEDRAAWKEWRQQIKEWEADAKLRRKEGRELPPSPELVSVIVGPPELPAPLDLPPPPELPPEPVVPPLTDLPPEPELEKPTLEASRYAPKVRRLERKAERKVRRLERKLARKLRGVDKDYTGQVRSLTKKRENYEKAAEHALAPSFVDRVLKRSPTQVAQRHKVALVRSRFQEQRRTAHSDHQLRVEEAHSEAKRQEAELEAQLIQLNASQEKAKRLGDKAELQAVLQERNATKTRLAETRAANQRRLKQVEEASSAQLKAALANLEEEERIAIEREERQREKPVGVPSKA